MTYSVEYSCFSHIGRVRGVNQDNYICNGQIKDKDRSIIPAPLSGTATSVERPLFGVFDGMGGEEKGEAAAFIASTVALETVIGNDASEGLLKICFEANRRICRFIDENSVSSSGTTAAMLAFTENGVVLCNVGDSPIFRLTGGKMKKISVDHVGFASFGRKPPLTQNLGIPEDEMKIEPYVAGFECVEGDRYLICSDGLTDMVSSEEIERILGARTMEHTVTELVAKALAAGGKDNVTVLALEIRGKR